MMIKKSLIFLFLIIFSVLAIRFYENFFYAQRTLHIDDRTVLHVDIADTTAKRIKGLSGREKMSEGRGMLFIFSSPQFLGFWMKGMHFPLDIIWLDQRCRIVYIAKAVPPCLPQEKCPSIQSALPAQYVLETVAHFSTQHDLKVGTQISLGEFCDIKTSF